MWIVLSLLSAALASTISGTGAVSFSDAAVWTGGVPGILTTVITIQAPVQVYVNSSFNFAAGVVTNLGIAGTAGTQLVLQGVTFPTATLTWANGYIVMQGAGATMTVLTSVNLAAGASIDRQIVGGKFSIGAIGVGSASLAGSLTCTGCNLDSNARTWTLNAGAFVFANTSAMASSAVYTGSGTVSVAAGAVVNLAASATLTVQSSVTTQVDGAILMGDNGGVDAFGAVTVGATGSVGGTAQSNFQVESTGNVTFTGGAGLRGGTITVDAGGSISINSAAGTTAVVVSGQATTTLAGAGTVTVNGRFDANTALTVTTPDLKVTAGGDFRIAGGATVNLKNVTFDTNSDWYLAFPDTGAFVGVTATGTVKLGGRFHLQLPSASVTGTVRLVTAASIIGTFNGAATITVGASAGRRLLASGNVVVGSNSIDYVGSGAASLGFVGLVAAFVLALF